MTGFSAAVRQPYYQDEHVTLYHGDCLEVTEWFEADVLVTDPPYGTRFTKDNPHGGYGRRQIHGAHSLGGAVIAGDDSSAVRDAALSNWGGKPALVFGSPRQTEPPGHWDERLVWDKVEPGMNGGPFRYTHENIFVRGDGWRRTSTRSYSILRFPRSDGMDNAERAQHPHRKPVGLLEVLLAAAPSRSIADPFAGSGSTLVAARNLGHRAIGVEIEERYCELIATRLSQACFDFGEDW